MTVEEREKVFWSKVDKSSGCWIWLSYVGANGRPYTSKESGGRGLELVHRRVWRNLVGTPLTPEIHLHHTCREPRCVNPDHLVPIDVAEHARLHAAENPKTHCPQGHPYDERNTRYRKNGDRVCKACESMRGRMYYARKTGRALEQIRLQKRDYRRRSDGRQGTVDIHE